MKKSIMNSKNTKYLLYVLAIVFIIGILYYFMAGTIASLYTCYTIMNINENSAPIIDPPPMSEESSFSEEATGNVIEPFNSSNMGYNQNKMIVIYTASWCPHCRSFMGMQGKDSPIGEDSEFAKTKNELGDCFQHVEDTDENSGERMQKHGIDGFPGIAFVDKSSDVGVPLTTNRTAEDICNKFEALSS
jgi:thiol-disulfide isomerase/thioredoxin